MEYLLAILIGTLLLLSYSLFKSTKQQERLSTELKYMNTSIHSVLSKQTKLSTAVRQSVKLGERILKRVKK